MARWPNGGPKKLYVVIDHQDAHITPFSSLRERREWVKGMESPLIGNLLSDGYTLLTYIQEQP